MGDVHGTSEAGFDGLRDLLRANLDSGIEVGVSVCAIHDGQIVADLWGGTADPGTGAPWERDTIVNTFSLTKPMTTLAALLLVDSGQLDLDAPVAHYWPEFAAAGKAAVLVRHILGHTSGVSGWQVPVTLEDLYDTDRATALLAAQEPWWSPGDGSGYHAMNQGHLVGEVIKRITGQSLGQFFATEIAGPLDADFWIGTPASLDGRIATLIAPPPRVRGTASVIPAQSVIGKTLLNPVLDVSRVASREWRAAELGAVNGHGNARSVARIQALVSLSEKTIDRIFDIQSDGVDRVLGVPIRFGVGYGLSCPDKTPEIPDGRVCWWTGYGGSIVVNDLDRRLTVAYVMNKMGPALIGLARGAGYLRAIYAALDS